MRLMCDICGKLIWKDDEVKEEAMRRMLAALPHYVLDYVWIDIK